MSLVDEKGNPVELQEEAPQTEELKQEGEEEKAPTNWKEELPDNVVAAYSVFVRQDGELQFMHHTQNLLDLIGLHEIARRNIDQIFNRVSGQDTTQALNVIGRMLQTVLQMLTNNSRQQFDMIKK